MLKYNQKNTQNEPYLQTQSEWKTRCFTCFLLGIIAGCIIIAIVFVIFAPELFGFSFFSEEV
ncbi:hypothetical protein SAMN02927921_00319 [Sinomicrobium oceani]|uniref:Uncharacterized protein n=1 Tax=Sinomicrobium oceani TaxID=1150368 RepID=A0A1K1M214_9FLAO|nr:hypothetical protein [Sinomicrobium oceani]SFW17153.1 hypothetical protein SAMN02927921_00319 [Sinomicrobium oceani]